MNGRRRARPLVAATAATMLALGLGSTSLGHAPSPSIGWPLFNPDQALTFDWKTGEVPPPAMRQAVIDAAADATASRGSRAPTLAYDAAGTSTVEYGANVFCGPAGLACADAWNAPNSFRLGFRLHGYSFDWGRLYWCQLQSEIANGCFDVENIALDEFGHAIGLNHHANYANDSDYLDSVVQTVSRARPKAGWDAAAFGRCDVARLQMRYDMVNSARKFSTCLDLVTGTSLATTDASIWAGETVTLTATLKVAENSAYERLSSNFVSQRSVVLQRRVPGSTTWTTIATMPAGLASGTYRMNVSPTATYEWRAYFYKPADEGIRASSSAPFAIKVSSCGSTCPQMPTIGQQSRNGR